jgi:hypothetical protein
VKKRKRKPPHQVSVTTETFNRLKAHVEATMPKHEQHGAMGRIIAKLLDDAERGAS